MKCFHIRFLFLIAIVLLYAPAAQPQNLLRNAGFETFVNGEPSNWTTSNIPGMLVLVSRSKESHSGKGGIKLEVKSFYGTKLAGTASQEDIPTTARQVLLSGYYTLKSVGGDKAFINMCLINENGSTVCVGNLNLDPAVSFKQFSLSLDAREGSGVVKAKICIAIIAGSDDQLHEGTTAIFDDCVLAPPSTGKDTLGEGP